MKENESIDLPLRWHSILDDNDKDNGKQLETTEKVIGLRCLLEERSHCVTSPTKSSNFVADVKES